MGHLKDELKNEISAIAHDLNNLLTPILLNARILQEMLVDDGNEIDPNLVTSLVESTERAQAIVQQLTRCKSAQTKGLLDVRCVIRSAVNSVGPRREDRQIEVSVAKDLWPVCGDETQLFRVILNLIVNALQATDSDGCIRITASNQCLPTGAFLQQHALVQMDVSDNGRGIPEELKQRIFSRHVTSGRSNAHSGIGLAVVREALKDLGGSVSLRSQPGKGTTFSVHLPTAPARSKRIFN